MGKYLFGKYKWMITRVTNWEYCFTPDLVIPKGMHWIVCPPGEDVLGPNVRWFRTGQEAISHVSTILLINRIRLRMGRKRIDNTL